MELSLYLAQLFGYTMIIFSVLAFFRPEIIVRTMHDIKPYSLGVMMAGLVGIVAGLATILSHNVWEFSYRGVVTLFGWSALLKGITYIAFPEVILKSADYFLYPKSRQKIALLFTFLLGAYLAYSGACAGYEIL